MTKKKSWKELIAAVNRTFRLWKVGMYSIDPMEPPGRRDRYHSPEQRKVTARFALAGKQIVLCAATEDQRNGQRAKSGHMPSDILVMTTTMTTMNQVLRQVRVFPG